MRARLGRMMIGISHQGDAVTANDIGIGGRGHPPCHDLICERIFCIFLLDQKCVIAGALTVLMKEAIMPTLMQVPYICPVPFIKPGVVARPT